MRIQKCKMGIIVLVLTLILCACTKTIPEENVSLQESAPVESAKESTVKIAEETQVEADSVEETQTDSAEETQESAAETEETQEETIKETQEETQRETQEETQRETQRETTSQETTVPASATKTYEVLNYEDMKAIWLSQFDMNGVYMDQGQQRPEASYRELLTVVLDNVIKNGFNTVIVQVRPNADSMYPSEYYPVSQYVVGAYGNVMIYDPLEILIEEAHNRNLSVHAWINPLRCMSVNHIEAVSDAYAVGQWYRDADKLGNYIVGVGNYYYLNPAYEEVRNLIINGASEIARNYNVDGVHMDDYFYPTQEADFDQYAYNAYRADGGTLNQADFRRQELNKLVSGIYTAVKSIDSRILFGISPAGNINNVYDVQFADVYTWCSTGGYLDYICPQVYFGMEHGTHDFVKVCRIWQDIIKSDHVSLIIGMTLGKAESGFDQYAGSGQNEWAENKDVLRRSLESTLNLDRCRGISVFCYLYFYSPTTGAPAEATQQERDNFVPLLKEITWK